MMDGVMMDNGITDTYRHEYTYSIDAWFVSDNGVERPAWTYPNYPDERQYLTDCDISDFMDKHCKEIIVIGNDEFLITRSWYDRDKPTTSRYFKKLVWFKETSCGHELTDLPRF